MPKEADAIYGKHIYHASLTNSSHEAFEKPSTGALHGSLMSCYT